VGIIRPDNNESRAKRDIITALGISMSVAPPSPMWYRNRTGLEDPPLNGICRTDVKAGFHVDSSTTADMFE